MTAKAAAATVPAQPEKAPIVKVKFGYVVSDKADKTAVVRVDSLSPHTLYKKRVRHSKRFAVHDEDNQAKNGDFVRIVEGRPRSKTKTWHLAEVIRGTSRAVVAEIGREEPAAKTEKTEEAAE